MRRDGGQLRCPVLSRSKRGCALTNLRYRPSSSLDERGCHFWRGQQPGLAQPLDEIEVRDPSQRVFSGERLRWKRQHQPGFLICGRSCHPLGMDLRRGAERQSEAGQGVNEKAHSGSNTGCRGILPPAAWGGRRDLLERPDRIEWGARLFQSSNICRSSIERRLGHCLEINVGAPLGNRGCCCPP